MTLQRRTRFSFKLWLMFVYVLHINFTRSDNCIPSILLSAFISVSICNCVFYIVIIMYKYMFLANVILEYLLLSIFYKNIKNSDCIIKIKLKLILFLCVRFIMVKMIYLLLITEIVNLSFSNS